jgi:hypothetical protein
MSAVSKPNVAISELSVLTANSMQLGHTVTQARALNKMTLRENNKVCLPCL